MASNSNDNNSPDASSSPSSNSVQYVLNRSALKKIHLNELFQIKPANASTISEKLAFWRASKGDVSVATRRLNETNDWRIQFGIDKILSDPSWLQKERDGRYLLKYDFLGLDQFGRPVMVERVGAWNVDDVLASASSEDDFLTLHCIACETMLRMDRPKDALDDRGQVIIMDCQGLSLWHLKPRLARAFGRLSTNDTAYYPDTLAHIFVVNAPMIFSALASLIQPFMDPDTYSKVHVSSRVPTILTDVVGVDCLPVCLGGKRENVFPYDEEAALSEHPKPETFP